MNFRNVMILLRAGPVFPGCGRPVAGLSCAALVLPALALLALTCPVRAEDRALIMGNRIYDNAAAIAAAGDVAAVGPVLTAAGFRVIAGADLGAAALRALAGELLVDREAGTRLVILMAGHFVRSEAGTWFLGVDADAPDLATVGGAGISLATVLEIASGAPGGAVVLLGTEERRITLGTGLAAGIGPLAVPQGVTVIRGEAAQVAAFAARDLATRGQSLAALVSARPDLIAEGFLSDLVPFLPLAPDAAPVGDMAAAAEASFWEATQSLATPDAYEAYLKRYPGGVYSTQALAEVTRARSEPGRDARLAEEALALSREARREVQRGLTLIGFPTRGIDGIFGAGTRAAVVAWQQKNAVPATSYLTKDQIVRITAQADRRAAELEAEAAARQAEQAAQDRAYWAETGSQDLGGDEASREAGLRAYLKRFPDGLYSEVAAGRLGAIEAARKADADGRDRAAWEQAEAAGVEAGYRAYLREYPEGAFAGQARERIAAMGQTAAEAGALAEAVAAETALGLNDITRTMIESRLDTLGLAPGGIDGVFDADGRRAVRRYQTARDLPATGYLSEQTVVRLLADTLGGLGGN